MNYMKISKDDVCNGDGFRVVLWVSGCPHHCPNCHNPETWDKSNGSVFDDSAIEEIIAEMKKDYISGITLSGGDPLYECNVVDVLNLLNIIKVMFPQKTVWLYTGYVWEYIWSGSDIDDANKKRQAAIKLCDVVIDGRYIDDIRDITLPWRGSKNQRVIDVKNTFKQGKVIEKC